MGRGRNKLIIGFLLWTILVSVTVSWTGTAFAKIYSVPKHNIEDSNLLNVKEGFDALPEALPNQVAQAWNSVFILYTSSPFNTATAFLVKKVPRADSQAVDLYFLTSRHSLDSFGCENMCAGSALLQDINLDYSREPVVDMGLNGLRFNSVYVVANSDSSDLALIAVAARKETANLLRPLGVSQSCNVQVREPLYFIGFSNTSLRQSSKERQTYNSNVLKKRWSEGVFVKYRNDLIATSVDALQGASGGPILNQSGAVVGVMKESSSVERNKYSYTGNEQPGQLDWTSSGVRCNYLQDFIDRSLKNSQN